MKTKVEYRNDEKLRSKLKKLFKNNDKRLDDEIDGVTLKPIKGVQPFSREIQKFEKQAEKLTKSEPKNKKEILQPYHSIQKKDLSPKSNKKSTGTKKYLVESVKSNKQYKKFKKSPDCKSNKSKVNMALEHQDEDVSSAESGHCDNENLFTIYEEYSSAEDDDYFVNYSESCSWDSEESYFGKGNSSDYEVSDYFDYENAHRYDSDNDPDYKLPQDVPEDLVIHKGTASKSEINKNEGIMFDSDNDDPQVVEINLEEAFKEIKQPNAYSKNELYKLNEESVLLKDTYVMNSMESECPLLVPINDEDDFQMNDIESEELSSDSSINEEYIHLKYVKSQAKVCGKIRNLFIKRRKDLFNVGIINVKNCTLRKIDKCNNLKAEFDGIEKMEIDFPISDFLTAKGKSLQIEDHCIVTVNIRDNTSQIPKKSKEFQNSKIKVQNENVLPIPQRVHKGMISNDSEDFPIPTSETNEMPSKELKSLQKTPKAAKAQLTSRTIFINAINSNVVLVLVKDPLYLYGTLCMSLLAGKVEIYGYKPQLNEEFEVFSPRGCSAVQIKCIPSDTIDSRVRQISERLKPFESSFSSHDLRSIENNFEWGQDAILLLKRNAGRRKMKNIFKNYMNENVFPNMSSIQPDRPFYASEYQVDCVMNTEAERFLRVPQEWQNLLFTEKSKVILVGGKSVGKSTLLRYLLNTQLEFCKNVLVIDLDIGQAEIFVPQTISCTVLNRPLLGPGFFLNHQPNRAYVVGHSNVVLCALTYMRAVKKLVDFCYSEEEFAGMPWLINTMGYNKGFGMELLSVIVQFIKPTDIVQLQSNKEINNFDEVLYPEVLGSIPRVVYTHDIFTERNYKSSTVVYRLHLLNSAIMQESRYQRDWEMSAKDLRFATFLSRLSDVLQGNAEWLTDCIPLTASIEKLNFLNMVYNASPREDLIHAIEANLVYLCSIGEKNYGPLQCYGIGVVRGIDFEKVYLLPAMPYNYLSEINCLALGEMSLPSSLFTNQGPKVRNMAAFLYNTVDAKTSKSIKQIYHRPQRFLTGKHKTVFNNSN